MEQAEAPFCLLLTVPTWRPFPFKWEKVRKGADDSVAKPLQYALDFFALAAVYFLWLRPRWSRRSEKNLAVNTVFYVYLTGVLYVTLMPILAALPHCFSHPYVPMQLMPFRDLHHGYGDAERQIVLNIIMTVPFGLLLPLSRRCAGKRCGFFRCLLLTAAMSLGIELAQPLLNGARSSDITDLITNTLGGLLGYGLYLATRPLIKRFTDN